MPFIVCPKCNERVPYWTHDVDIVHSCTTGNSVLDDENVFVNGNYIDRDTGELVLRNNTNFQGRANKLVGTIAQVKGKKVEDLNVFAKPTNRNRLRKHFEYINLKGDRRCLRS